ncbi:MAG: hypothetical protein Q9164_003564 [Protoblastenia rupestris]
MASTAPGYLSPQSQSTLRTPRLKYRTSSNDVETIGTATSNQSSISITSNLTSPTQSDFCISPRYPPSDVTTSSRSSAPSIAESSSTPPGTPGKPPKKKQSFFSGLFTVKEPSAQALADYQKQLSKHGTVKHGRVTAVGMPGVSSATLPPEVPKVNSKWDGVPQSLKEKDRKKHAGTSHPTLTGSRDVSTAESGSSAASSTRTSHSRRTQSRGTLGGTSMYTAHSSGSRNHLADLYGWEVTENTSGGSARSVSMEHSRPSVSRSTSAKSAHTLPSNASALFDIPKPPKIPKSYFDHPLSPDPPAHSHSPSLTPRESLPTTPNEPSSFVSTVPKGSQNTLQDSQDDRPDDLRVTIIEAPTAIDEVITKSSGINILGPPLSAKRGHKSPLSQRNDVTSARSLALHPILKKESSTPQQRPPINSCIQCPPSSDRSQPENSVKERLGIGLHLKIHDQAATWELPEQHYGNGERTLTPTPESDSHSLRKKSRISLFKK